MNKQYTQQEIYEIMQKYDKMDRKVIKQNLNQMKDKTRLTSHYIADKLDFKDNKVLGWFNPSNPVIPTFRDCILFCNIFGESIEDVVKDGQEDNKINYIYLDKCIDNIIR